TLPPPELGRDDPQQLRPGQEATPQRHTFGIHSVDGIPAYVRGLAAARRVTRNV
ncbi:hypothetical protein N136_01380, partial [Leifsonia aquatica ATCC 14665]